MFSLRLGHIHAKTKLYLHAHFKPHTILISTPDFSNLQSETNRYVLLLLQNNCTILALYFNYEYKLFYMSIAHKNTEPTFCQILRIFYNSTQIVSDCVMFYCRLKRLKLKEINLANTLKIS